jgi:hypothetical protein
VKDQALMMLLQQTDSGNNEGMVPRGITVPMVDLGGLRRCVSRRIATHETDEGR